MTDDKLNETEKCRQCMKVDMVKSFKEAFIIWIAMLLAISIFAGGIFLLDIFP